MYIATIVNDTDAASPTYNHLIGKLVQTLSGASVAPPITADYTPCATGSSGTTTSTSSSSETTSTVTPGFGTPLLLMGLTFAVVVVNAKKNKKI